MRFVHHVRPSLGSKTTITGSGPRLVMAGPDSIDLLKSLDIGDLLIGRVAKILDDSRVLMDFRGTELVATTTLPVAEGVQIRGIVQAKGPPLVLKIVAEYSSEKSKIFVRFKSLVSQLLPAMEEHPVITLLKTPGITGSDWTEPLARWLTALALEEGTPIDPQCVRAALIHGGMFYERKLRQWVEAGGKGNFQEAEIDLKGMALKLLGQMESHGKGADFLPEKATKLLESLISKIELFQTANWLAQEEGLGFIFQIPLRFGDNLRTADLLVGFPHRKRGKKDGLRILLLLDMGGLGRLQIYTHISQKGVAAGIGVDREETVALVRSMIEELKKGLENQGLTVLGIECFLLKKSMAKEDLFQQLLDMGEVEGVNIRV